MQRTRDFYVYTKQHGPRKALSLVRKLKSHLMPTPLPNYQRYLPYFQAKAGLEIGGPSKFFHKRLPIYQGTATVDCVNFATNTVWQGNITQGQSFRFYKDRIGYQYIADAIDLHIIESAKYDFCLASNVIEHIANPLEAISEWLRVLKDDGLLLIVAPRKEANFDHRRPTTTFDHLLHDYSENVSEGDLSHLQEILSLHDLSREFPTFTHAQFKQRCLDNLRNRTMHQHVFDMGLLEEIFRQFRLDVVEKTTVQTEYVILGRKHMTST